MRKLEVEKLNPILKEKLILWDMYKGSEGFEKIKKYMSMFGVENYLKQIETDNRIYKDESLVYVLKENEEPKSFIRMKVEGEEKPKIFIQGMATHPLEQSKGYAAECLNIILKNPKKYLAIMPAEMYGLVDVKNNECKSLFQKFGNTKITYYGIDFDLVETTIDYDKILKEDKNK